jgi:hypothetical protein
MILKAESQIEDAPSIIYFRLSISSIFRKIFAKNIGFDINLRVIISNFKFSILFFVVEISSFKLIVLASDTIVFILFSTRFL